MERENTTNTCCGCGKTCDKLSSDCSAQNTCSNCDKLSEKVHFEVNGKLFTVDSNVGSTYTLLDFLREKAHLTGTKFMCREGGCGACVVSVKVPDPLSVETSKVIAVNACLRPVLGCDGWEITTVEGLGNRISGYHPIQKCLAEMNGSQCGFCSSGMVMTMYSTQQQDAGFSTETAEHNLDGNICRCTGYRPIIDAFNSLKLKDGDTLPTPDIEELGLCNGGHRTPTRNCSSNGEKCENESPINKIYCNRAIRINGLDEGTTQWLRPITLPEVLELLDMLKKDNYQLVAGNTSSGVFKPLDSSITTSAYIDLSAVPDLRTHSLTPVLTLGGAITLNEALTLLPKAIDIDKGQYDYLNELITHINKIGSHAVRDMGTLAGNLCMKHSHHEFPSDLFTILETVGATIVLIAKGWGEHSFSPRDFLKEDMKGKLLLKITFPLIDSNLHAIRTFKIMPRYQFSLPIVNAGFLAKIDKKQNYKIIGKPTIVYGGITPSFIHATKTEAFLECKVLNNQNILQEALQILSQEIVPDAPPAEASPEYRKNLAVALFYKFVLHVLRDEVSAHYLTGKDDLVRGNQQSRQNYSTDKTQWPINQPLIKIEAQAQCAGEAQYINDIPPKPEELHGAFVLSTIAKGMLKSIDTAEAMKLPGVVAFYQAKDIPGKNNAMPDGFFLEEVFSSGKIVHSGQALGIIIADNHQNAVKAARMVKVTYTNIEKPVLTIKEALDKDIVKYGPDLFCEAPKQNGKESQGDVTTVSGEMEIGSQYHLSMETQICICVPNEDGMEIYCAAQWTDLLQQSVAQVLNVHGNTLSFEVRRLGGAYGAKISRPALVVTGCALAAHKLNKPVRVLLDMEDNMEMIGKRLPYLAKYTVSFDKTGSIQTLEGTIICDCGSDYNEITSMLGAITAQNCYNAADWKWKPGQVMTNTPSNTYCRAPGSTQGIAIIENIMEHIARTLGKDPMEVRRANFLSKGDAILSTGPPCQGQSTHSSIYGDDDPLPQIIKDLQESANFKSRRLAIDEFNQVNRWKKRGMSLVPMRYPVHYGFQYNALVTIYHQDGTVAVAHGGIECGQGINTKVAQVVAKELGISLDMVKIRPTNNLTNPNCAPTGGAVASELMCHAAKMCCQDLLNRMKPMREEMKNPPWDKLVAACHIGNISLLAEHLYSDKDNVKTYNVVGATITEVEVDILTGQHNIKRVDLVEDAGRSLNPEVDIGQVEGAFVMGLGLWLTEKLKHHPDTGRLLTSNTWTYHPPTSKDIPEDFRVTLLKNAVNPFGVLGSKATGEPPICMSVGVIFAIRDALDSARKDVGKTDAWFQMDGPVTVEDVHRFSLTNEKQFVLK